MYYVHVFIIYIDLTLSVPEITRRVLSSETNVYLLFQAFDVRIIFGAFRSSLAPTIFCEVMNITLLILFRTYKC